jgi:hypothetical protein
MLFSFWLGLFVLVIAASFAAWWVYVIIKDWSDVFKKYDGEM